MLGDRHDIFGARLFEQGDPSLGIPLLGFEHGDEVLVPEL